MTHKPVPYSTPLDAGRRYSWCACGLSAKQPFCDGSHRSTQVKPLAFSEQEALTVALCGCKRTQNPPFCDGSHKTGGT